MEMEAAQWVARRMGDEPFDKAGFDAWLAGDSRRQPLFDLMWHRLMGTNMDGALKAYGRRRQNRQRQAAAGVAAALVLFCGYKAWPSIEMFVARPLHYVATAGTVHEVTLEDGSRLTLAGGADIQVRYSRHGRQVELRRGTLFANVARDERRPFDIVAGEGLISVLGTRFEVSSNPTLVRVTVESGKVSFGKNSWFSAPIRLTADQAAVLANGSLRRVGHVGPGHVARWREEWVTYSDVPMKQVIADLQSLSPLPIELADKTLAERRVSGRIRMDDALRQIRNLSITHNFSVEQRGQIIILSNR